MSQPSENIAKFLVLFVIGVFVIKSASNAGFFEAKSHKGRGYYVKIPEGWIKAKKQKDALYPEGVEAVTFVPKGTDTEAGPPEIYISIFAKKLTTPIWIEDEFPDILRSIEGAGFKVMDKGEIKLDGKISKWVVYHDRKAPALTLEFYMVTDNNMFYKMQYSAEPDQFNRHRRSFEELKDSFRFRFSLY